MRATACALLLLSCTYVVVNPKPLPKDGCPSEDIPYADIVYVSRLSRRIVGLSQAISGLDLTLTAAIAKRKVYVGHALAVPMVPEPNAAGALYFASCEQKAPAPLGDVLAYFAKDLVTNNKTDCELSTLAEVAPSFATITPSYPPALLNGTLPPAGTAFFGKPPKYLLVVVIDPQSREHAYSECQIGGDSLADYFSSDSWVAFASDFDKDKVFFLSIVTNESLEGDAAFRQECLGMPGFPKPTIDALSPSPKFFFKEFNKAYPDGRARTIEMCEALAEDGINKLDAFIKFVHGRVGLPED